jgi:hypothetical protein
MTLARSQRRRSMAELPRQSSGAVNGRRFLSESIAAGQFAVSTTEELPAAELDGEPVSFIALLYALIVALGNGSTIRLPRYVPVDDYQRARAVLRELGAPR